MAGFPSESKLMFWAENGLNVLFEGPHGVGKTALAELTFNNTFGERGKDWLYFSAATMDPWVDFVGVPKEQVAEDGTVYLGLVRPEVFQRDQVKGIIFDEFNRAPKKVRNAVMELMQFGSINGHKFQNLSCVWAAINPSDDDDTNYDVEDLDPAQRDRFHVQFRFGYDVSNAYFYEKYGEKGNIACEWWRSLPEESRKAISPRRLDYTMKVEHLGGSVKDVIPEGIPVNDLVTQLKSGSFIKILEDIVEGKKTNDEITQHLIDQGFYNFVENRVKDDDNLAAKIVPFMSPENSAKFFQSNSIDKINKILAAVDITVNPDFTQTLSELAAVSDGVVSPTKRKKISTWLTRHLKEYEYTGSNEDLKSFLDFDVSNPYTESEDQTCSRIQSFINAIASEELKNIKDDEELRGMIINIWSIIFQKTSDSLANIISERAKFSLNGSRKVIVKEGLIEFFNFKEFCSESTENKARMIIFALA